MAEKRCASCGATLLFLMREELQLGKNSFLLGSRTNLTAGALDTGIWACPICGKLELLSGRIGGAAGGKRHCQGAMLPLRGGLWDGQPQMPPVRREKRKLVRKDLNGLF